MQPDKSSTNRAQNWCLGIFVALVILAVFLPVSAVIAFYYVEDWRGTATWEKAKAEIDARGISLDPKKYEPSSIPVATNFGALPLFETAYEPRRPGTQTSEALNSALEPITTRLLTAREPDNANSDKLPYLEKWTTGKQPDSILVQGRLEKICHKVNPYVPLPGNASSTDLLEILCPALKEFRSNNLTHLDCVFPFRYKVEPPTDLSFAPITSFIRMGQVLIYEERLALYEKNPALALDDMSVCWKVAAGLHKQPFLVSALVANALTEMELVVIQQGLHDHDWNDAQLTSLDANLGKQDLLTNARFAITGDIVVFSLPSTDYYETHRLLTPLEYSILRGDFAAPPLPPNYLGRIGFWFTPKGWFDQDKAMDARFRLLGTIDLIDPVTRRVFPDKEVELLRSYAGIRSPVFPDKPFLNPDSSLTHSVKNFAYCQVHVDEARIACRLERYRLFHGQYPGTLDALVPAFGSELPHDIMNGEPYHYKLQPDGAYLLYSVGWDQDDGGGKLAAPNQPLRDAADWVWRNQLDSEKTK